MKSIIPWPEEIPHIDILLLVIQLQGPHSLGQVSFQIIQKVRVEDNRILLNILSRLLSFRGAEMQPVSR